MSGRIPRDLIGGILFLLIGVAVLVAIPSNIQDVERGLEVGPRYVPLMMAIIIVGLSLVLIIKSLVGLRAESTERVTLLSVLPTLEAAGVVGLVILWTVALRFLNYLVVSSVTVILGLLLFRVRKIGHYAIAIGFVGVVWALFTFLLKVRLP